MNNDTVPLLEDMDAAVRVDDGNLPRKYFCDLRYGPRFGFCT